MAYVLDANVFISAKNLHYGLDFCPAFWDWLVENNAAGKVFSIEKEHVPRLVEILGGSHNTLDHLSLSVNLGL